VGGGTDDRYAATANVNMFNNETQLSVFGGANNNNTSTFNFDGGAGGGGTNFGGGGGGNRAFQVNVGGNNQGGIGGDEGLRVSNSLGMNFRNDFKEKKGSIYGNYSYSARETDVRRDVASQNFFESTKFLNSQNTQSLSNSRNHRASINLEWNIDSFNYIKFIPEFTFRDNDSRSTSDFGYLRNDVDLTSNGINNDSSFSKSPNFSGNLIFNHKFKKRGRNLSVNINGGYNSTDGEADKINITNNYFPILSSILLDQQIITDNRSNNFNIRFNYSEPIMKDRYLDFIYSYGRFYTRNDRNTSVLDTITGNY
jgi:hypothetical protein